MEKSIYMEIPRNCLKPEEYPEKPPKIDGKK